MFIKNTKKNFKRIILVGRGGSGKNYLSNILTNELGIQLSPLYTARPQRNDEEHGREYFFVEEEDFVDLISINFFNSYINRRWLYGLRWKDWNKYNLFILTPEYLKQIDDKELDESLIVYINTPDDVILERLKNRKLEKNCTDDVERRIESDNKDFMNFENYDIRLDINYNPDDLINYILTTNSFF